MGTASEDRGRKCGEAASHVRVLSVVTAVHDPSNGSNGVRASITPDGFDPERDDVDDRPLTPIELLYCDCRKAVRSAVRSLGCGSRYDSDDLVHALYLKWEERVQSDGNLPTYMALYREARRQIIHWLNLEEKRLSIDEQVLAASCDRACEESDCRDAVETLCEQLSVSDRETVSVFIENLGDPGATARALGIFPNTLCRRLSRIRDSVRQPGSD
jgi:DNA-directed RNA polymerase specialized sigma24 family protein